MATKKLQVLMLEDDADDRYLTQEVLDGLNMELHIDFYANSQEFFNALVATTPNLVLVDFNATPENGLQVLKRIRNESSLKHVPVVILSESELPRYRTECYAAGANSFVTKPTTVAETKRKIKAFFTYWTEVAET